MKIRKGYERKGDKIIYRFLYGSTGYESRLNLLRVLEKPWYVSRYSWLCRFYPTHVTISIVRIRRTK